MAIRASYSESRAQLATFLDRVTDDHETVIISRRGRPDVALISADELSSLEETAHLLRSPNNAARLLAALSRALGESVTPQSVESLRAELGLGTSEER
jgi:antitoxin YefM